MKDTGIRIAIRPKTWLFGLIWFPNIEELKRSGNIGGLLRVLEHPRPKIRWSAMRALGELWQLPDLIDLGNHDWETCTQAAKNLGQRQDLRTVAPLVASLWDPFVMYYAEIRYYLPVRISAIKALGELGSSLAIEPLIEALRRNSWGYPAEGDEPLFASLIKFGEPMFIRLVDLLKDEDQEMRFWAVRALGYFADTRAIEPLIEIFSNETESLLKRAVARSIFLIGDKRAAPVLINALRQETNPVILPDIFELLNKMTSEYVIECLLEVISKAENEEKSRVIDAALEYSKPEVSTAISNYVDANK